jgi:hypothetical protein
VGAWGLRHALFWWRSGMWILSSWETRAWTAAPLWGWTQGLFQACSTSTCSLLRALLFARDLSIEVIKKKLQCRHAPGQSLARSAKRMRNIKRRTFSLWATNPGLAAAFKQVRQDMQACGFRQLSFNLPNRVSRINTALAGFLKSVNDRDVFLIKGPTIKLNKQVKRSIRDDMINLSCFYFMERLKFLHTLSNPALFLRVVRKEISTHCAAKIKLHMGGTLILKPLDTIIFAYLFETSPSYEKLDPFSSWNALRLMN